MKKIFVKVLILFIVSNFISKAHAHHPDNSLLYLKIYENANIEGDFHININELNDVLGLNLSNHTSLEEVAPYLDKIKAYLKKNTSFVNGNKAYEIKFTNNNDILAVSYGDFILFNFYLEDSYNVPDSIGVTYKVFIEEEPHHSNLLGIEYNWKSGLFNNESLIALDFNNNDWTKTLDLTQGSVWTGFKAMIKQGIWHIWIGLDHILFILALILPAVVRRKPKYADTGSEISSNIWNWYPVEKFKPAFFYIIKIITFFTIAHTITLSLASLQIIVLPSRLVESIIALSIGLAAYHNIRPIFKGKDWMIAFIFGLFHGFGFASVLGELGFNGEHLSLSLLGFNIGVEIGQVAIIAVIFPILYFIRKLKVYPKFLVYLSTLLIIISIYWLIERGFDVNLPVDDYIRRAGYKLAVFLGLR
ncbi:HupE/UreJ family protein [Algibacter mikhailovii]|uniref:Membrane protein n=1 Tax=Algibacter mikhailovii TaxID=425498 RepID=A0A918QW30_9FLAO|nr:HupE/UreJ family protein [Algibacter mikhailovii]GGZ71044.1 membrane protein [Algibacter mikhailovii]